jgi:hypothetical protein
MLHFREGRLFHKFVYVRCATFEICPETLIGNGVGYSFWICKTIANRPFNREDPKAITGLGANLFNLPREAAKGHLDYPQRNLDAFSWDSAWYSDFDFGNDLRSKLIVRESGLKSHDSGRDSQACLGKGGRSERGSIGKPIEPVGSSNNSAVFQQLLKRIGTKPKPGDVAPR